VPFTCVAVEISKLLLWESLAANALLVNANASVASMIRENNVDFITAPFDSFPQFGGNRLRAAFFGQVNELFNSLPDDLQSSAWVKKQTRVCVPISGDCSRLGPPNRGREHSLNPVNPTATFQLLSCSIFSSYLQRRCQTIKSFNQFVLA
jgi:hypothetical protein